MPAFAPTLLAILALAIFPDSSVAKVCNVPADCGSGLTCFRAGRDNQSLEVSGRCEAGAPGLPCEASSDCTRGYCRKSPLVKDEGKFYCGVLDPCTSADECEAGEVCAEVQGDAVCIAGIWSNPCRTSSECVGILECVDTICSEVGPRGTRDVIAPVTSGGLQARGLAEDWSKIISCFKEAETLRVSPSVSKKVQARGRMQKMRKTMETAVSALLFAGAATLGAHSFVVSKLPNSMKYRVLRLCLCVGTGLLLLLAFCLQVAVATKRSAINKSLDIFYKQTAPGVSCASSVMGIPKDMNVSFLTSSFVRVAANLVSVTAISFAGVLEVVRTERLRRLSSQRTLGVRSRWIFLILIAFVLFALNTGVSVVSSLLEVRLYIPNLEGCEQKRYGGNRVEFSCNPNAVLRKYRYIGAGVSEACESFEKDALLEPNKTPFCSPEELKTRLKEAGATENEVLTDSFLNGLMWSFLLGEMPRGYKVATSLGGMVLPTALLCVAIINAIVLILIGWNVSHLLICGKRRKLVVVLAVLYILLTFASVALKQLGSSRFSDTLSTSWAISACGCSHNSPSRPEVNVGIDIGGFKDVVMNIIIPSLVATMALNEVLMKRDGNEDEDLSAADKAAFEDGSSESP